MKHGDMNIRSPMPPPTKCHWPKGRRVRLEQEDIGEGLEEWEITRPHPKKKRVVDLIAIRDYKLTHRHCEWCGRTFDLRVHHLKSRGAGGDDVPENFLRLCMYCDTKAHNKPGFNQRLKEMKIRRG